jgi:cell division protein FtsB
VARNVLSIQARAERRRRAVVSAVLAFVILTALVLNFFLGDMGYVQFVSYKAAEESLLEQISKTRRENDLLRSEVGSLEKNPEAVERLARESLDMMREDEIIFKFKEQ